MLSRFVRSLLVASLSFSSFAFAATESFDDEFTFLGGLEKNLDNTDSAVIDAHIQKATAIERTGNLSKEQLTEIYLIESGLIGLQAKKKKSAKLGKESFDKLQDALKLSPEDSRVVKSYAESVASMNSSSSIAKIFIQKSLNINLAECRQIALAHLAGLNAQPGTADYEAVKALREKLII
jgi:hypothetical protein